MLHKLCAVSEQCWGVIQTVSWLTNVDLSFKVNSNIFDTFAVYRYYASNIDTFWYQSSWQLLFTLRLL